MAVTPEEIGLCGCWQVIAVERQSLELCRPEAKPTREVGYYATSLSVEERDDAAIAATIRGHWSAIENGTHYRRDVTLGEDACRTADRGAAAVLASLRNLRSKAPAPRSFSILSFGGSARRLPARQPARVSVLSGVRH